MSNSKTIEKALIIDDEEEIGILLGFQLKKLGIKNDYAPNLKDGQSLFDEEDFDVVFLDINLPDGNGLEIIPDLKEKKEDIAIIVISAYNVEEDKSKAYELGADHFLGKPFNGQQVAALIKD